MKAHARKLDPARTATNLAAKPLLDRFEGGIFAVRNGQCKRVKRGKLPAITVSGQPHVPPNDFTNCVLRHANTIRTKMSCMQSGSDMGRH